MNQHHLPWRPRRDRRTLYAALSAAILSGTAVYLAMHQVEPPASSRPLTVAEDATPGMGAVDAGVVLAADMPGKPLPGQKHAPCAEDELEHGGACWVETKRRPPCKDQYRLREACYVPAGEAKRTPVTGEP